MPRFQRDCSLHEETILGFLVHDLSTSTLDGDHRLMPSSTTAVHGAVGCAAPRSDPRRPVSRRGPRQVPGACWSTCDATLMPKAVLRLWNEELAERMGGLSPAADVWVGAQTLEGMRPHAHRYGGHQFGTWAGQLGDGRALSLGHAHTCLLYTSPSPRD